MRIGDGFRIGVATACATIALGPQSLAGAIETATQSFTVAGEHVFVVPPAVTSLQVTLVGGYGGPGSAGTPGGIPATSSATLAVSPGETLYVEVAGDGESAEGSEDRGGYGGGGHGGIRSFLFASTPGGGGGGGASDVRTCPAEATPTQCGGQSSLLSRLLIAAGGGGGGGNGLDPPSTAGGVGGAADQSGSAGAHDTATDFGGGGGLRASSSIGGAAGGRSGACEPISGNGCATKGELGNGGAGGESIGGGGGGGGSGIFGGGGGGSGELSNVGTAQSPIFANGGGGGGGGGSSGIPAGATGVSGFSLMPTTEGAEPSASFSWIAPAPTVLTEAASKVTPTTAILNGTVNPNAWQPTGCSFTVSPAPTGVSTFPCAQQLAIGITPTPVSATATGLTPGTIYSMTLTASTIQGASNGASVSFTTPNTISSGSPGASTSASAALNVTALKLSPPAFRRGKHVATLSKAKAKKVLPTATTISFQLSVAATVTFAFEEFASGVLSGHSCVAISKARAKGRRCMRYTTIHGGVTLAGKAGLDKVRFEGILDGNKRLAPGTYRLSLIARTATGSTTATQRPAFQLKP